MEKELRLRLDNEELEQVTGFMYLEGLITEDVKFRIGLTSAVFGRLSKMWRMSSPSSARTKLKLYRAFVTPVLLYGSKCCWCIQQGDYERRRLFVTETSWLGGRIQVRTRRDRIWSEVIRRELGQMVTLVDNKIRKQRLAWVGHVTRMNNRRLPATALYGHVD